MLTRKWWRAGFTASCPSLFHFFLLWFGFSFYVPKGKARKAQKDASLAENPQRDSDGFLNDANARSRRRDLARLYKGAVEFYRSQNLYPPGMEKKMLMVLTWTRSVLFFTMRARPFILLDVQAVHCGRRPASGWAHPDCPQIPKIEGLVAERGWPPSPWEPLNTCGIMGGGEEIPFGHVLLSICSWFAIPWYLNVCHALFLGQSQFLGFRAAKFLRCSPSSWSGPSIDPHPKRQTEKPKAPESARTCALTSCEVVQYFYFVVLECSICAMHIHNNILFLHVCNIGCTPR